MQDAIVEFMLAGEDWLPYLRQEMRQLRTEEGTEFLERVFFSALQADISVQELGKLMHYNIQRSKNTDSYVDVWWHIVAYGNEDHFEIMFEDNDYSKMDVIFEGAVSVGNERLLLVLSWLENVVDHYEFFEAYLRELDDIDEKLTEEQKQIILTTSEFLGIDPMKHGWRDTNGVVDKWLKSLREDV